MYNKLKLLIKMARNIFSLSFILPPLELSIKETAFKLLSLLEILRKEDAVYGKFKVSQLHFKKVAFDLNEMGFDKAVTVMEELFLRFHKADIKELYLSPPADDIIRVLGFMFLLVFDEKGKNHFSLSGNLSSTKWNSLSIENFTIENSNYDFDWYFNILRKINEFLNPIYSGVNIILPQYIEMYLPLKVIYPLGWITYFANESKIKMPNDIGFEVVQEEKGQYVFATREDFTVDKESFFAMKEKLIEGMKLLKSTCIQYSETESPT